MPEADPRLTDGQAPLAEKDNLKDNKGHYRLDKGHGRKESVIKFLRRRGESVIKDITKALPEIGEKTIQRDLRELVEEGKIKRFGQRRWSRYSLV